MARRDVSPSRTRSGTGSSSCTPRSPGTPSDEGVAVGVSVEAGLGELTYRGEVQRPVSEEQIRGGTRKEDGGLVDAHGAERVGRQQWFGVQLSKEWGRGGGQRAHSGTPRELHGRGSAAIRVWHASNFAQPFLHDAVGYSVSPCRVGCLCVPQSSGNTFVSEGTR